MKEFTWNNSKGSSPTKNSNLDDTNNRNNMINDDKNRNSPSRKLENPNKLTLQSFNSILEKISPKTESKVCVFLLKILQRLIDVVTVY
jgi:hypothetical protein